MASVKRIRSKVIVGMHVIISSVGRGHSVDFRTISDAVKHKKLLFLPEIELRFLFRPGRNPPFSQNELTRYVCS